MKKALLKQYPTGIFYIKINYLTDWHSFPLFAEKFLGAINATQVKNVSRMALVDSHFYDFSLGGDAYSLVYEDYPRQIILESRDEDIFVGNILKQINDGLDLMS